MLVALAVIFSMVESFVAPLLPVPAIRLGLSNIVTMFVFFALGMGASVLVLTLKSVFVLIGRGLVAFVLSAGGGLVAILFIFLLYYAGRNKTSVLVLSVVGAVVHNVTQLLLVRLIYGMDLIVYMLPILIASGIAAGALNAYLLKLMMPLLKGIWRRYDGMD